MALGLPSDPAQQKRLLIGLLPLLIVFGYWYLLHRGYQEELDRTQARVERLERTNATTRARSTEGRALEERLARFERHIDRLEELVPRGEEVPQILNQIHQRAEQVGVEVAVFRPGQSTAGPHYTHSSFELTVYGTYHNIGRLLADIGSLPRIITPMDLEISPRNELDRSGQQRLEASFNIVTYVLQTAPAAAAQQGGPSGA